MFHEQPLYISLSENYLLKVLFSVCLLCLMHDVIMAEFKMASACYGAGNDCFYMSLECASGQKIRLISQNYGIKEDDCNDKKNKCLG